MSSSNIDRLTETSRAVFEATEAVVADMKDKDRKQVKDLATAVSSRVGKAPKEILHLVDMFAHDCDNGYVTRGKGGGFIKGVKVVKPAKAVKVEADVVVDSASDESEG